MTSSLYKIAFTVIAFLLSFREPLHAQLDSVVTGRYYKVNKTWELPTSAAAIIGSYFGFRNLDKISVLTVDDLAKLNTKNVNSIDRHVINYNPSGYDYALKRSDFFLNFCMVSPAILLLDKKARHNSLDLLTLFMVAHTVDNAFYFAAAYSFRRARPFTYRQDLSVDYRSGNGKTISFYSGHVAFSATATAFAAKVYTDYHQIKGWKRITIFTMAEIPPIMVGYYRVRSGRHFYSDAALGLAVGTACGIAIPELHHYLQKHQDKFSLSPIIAPGYNGLTLNMKL